MPVAQFENSMAVLEWFVTLYASDGAIKFHFETQCTEIASSYSKQNHNKKSDVIIKLVTAPAQKKIIGLTIIPLTGFELGSREIKVVAGLIYQRHLTSMHTRS
jgi:hypothetical protein